MCSDSRSCRSGLGSQPSSSRANRVYLFTESAPTEDKPDVWLVPQEERGRGSVILVLRVDDCDAAYEEVRDRGGEFLTPPATPPWGGQRCFLHDPDGYVVELEQPPEYESDDVIDRLVARGLAKPAKGNLSDLSLPMKPEPGSRLPSEALDELRSGER